MNDINKLKENAASLGGNLGNNIIEFVDNQIIPVVKNAESAGLLLKSEVAQLPVAAREPNGSLVFENGKIQLDGVN